MFIAHQGCLPVKRSLSCCIKTGFEEYVTKQCHTEAKSKSPLKYLNIDAVKTSLFGVVSKMKAISRTLCYAHHIKRTALQLLQIR